MSGRISLQAQFFFSLLVALALGWVYQSYSTDADRGRMPVVATEVPVYKVLPDGWRVEVRFDKHRPPEVLAMKALEQIRLGSVSKSGDYSLVVFDNDGHKLFSQRFQVYFLRTGSSMELEQVSQTLVIPYFETAAEIIIHAPEGDAYYAIP